MSTLKLSQNRFPILLRFYEVCENQTKLFSCLDDISTCQWKDSLWLSQFNLIIRSWYLGYLQCSVTRSPFGHGANFLYLADIRLSHEKKVKTWRPDAVMTIPLPLMYINWLYQLNVKSPASRLFTQPFVQSVDQRKHQSSASLAFVRGIHQSPMNSPHKGPVTRIMFPFDDVVVQCIFLKKKIIFFYLG